GRTHPRRPSADSAPCSTVLREAALVRRVRHLERGGALVGDLAPAGATEGDAVLRAAVDRQLNARAGARVRRHDLHARLRAGPELSLDLYLELECYLRGLRELDELGQPVA